MRSYFNSEVREILPHSVRLDAGGSTPESIDLPNDYVFVLVGGEPPYGLLKRMGVQFGGQAASSQPPPTPRA